VIAGAWLRSVAHRQALPYFAWDDPLPSVAITLRVARRVSASTARALASRARAVAERRARAR